MRSVTATPLDDQYTRAARSRRKAAAAHGG
jgi:hypothetical protein